MRLARRSPPSGRQLAHDLCATPFHSILVRRQHEQPLRSEGRVVAVGIQLAYERSLASDPRLALGEVAPGPSQFLLQL
jgi:hypothetical protein